MSFPDPFSIMIAMNLYRTTPHVSIREMCDPQVVDHKYGSGVASRTSRQSRGSVASNQHRLKFCDVLNEANEMHKKLIRPPVSPRSDRPSRHGHSRFAWCKTLSGVPLKLRSMPPVLPPLVVFLLEAQEIRVVYRKGGGGFLGFSPVLSIIFAEIARSLGM